MRNFFLFSYKPQVSVNNGEKLEIANSASRGFTRILIPHGLLGIYGMTLNVEIFEISAYTHVY